MRYRSPTGRVCRDLNHHEIMTAFQQLGCKVIDCATVGGGFPDLLVLDSSKVVRLVEIKNPGTRYGRNGLNPRQQEMADEGWPIVVCRTIDDVIDLTKSWKRSAEDAAGL